jgi:thiol-disulfide isomerase/thioredoxin
MKKYVFTVIALLISTLIFAQQKGMVVIKGTLNGDLKGYNAIYMYTRTSNDSTAITNGKYTFSFPFTKVGMKFLYPKYIKEMHMMYQPFGILITEPGTYYVVSDIVKGMPASQLKGPESMVLYHQYEEEEKEAYKNINPALNKLYGEKWWQADEKDSNYARIQKSSDSLREVFILPMIQKLVKEHPDSYASAYVLSGSGRQVGSLESKEKLYNMLSAEMKKTDAGKNFGDYIEGLKSSSIGKMVADFKLPDPDGKEVDFKKLRGKYVLIDFWASWCVPCRRSFPHMREVYKKFKSDKFEIYSVSIDEDKKAWLKAVKEEKNPWLQSLDTKNISQKGFAVTGVPSTFLIDPKGKIIAKEVGFDPNGGSEIEKKLGEVLAP